MLTRKPTKSEIDTVMEVYRAHQHDEITLYVLREARNRTGLGLMTCREIIEDCISYDRAHG